MRRYDPEVAPDPAEWLALGELERIRLAEAYHNAAGIELPNLKSHAVFHSIVENQLAEELDPVVRAMARLLEQGLTRHDALHAIGSVVAEHLFEVLSTADAALAKTAQARYEAAVEQLNAAESLR